jgi:hypothetical protein
MRSRPMIEVSRDAAGDLRAEGDSNRRLLFTFLEGEIQESAAVADELLSGIAEVLAGKRRFGWTGNARSVVITAKRARIIDDWTEERIELKIPLIDFRAALVTWKAAIEADAAAD